jgi:hypothetical protein
VRSGGAEAFIGRVRALPLPGRLLSGVGPLLAVIRPPTPLAGSAKPLAGVRIVDFSWCSPAPSAPSSWPRSEPR